MSFDGVQSHAAAVTGNGKSIGLRSFFQEFLAMGVIIVCATLAFILVDVKKELAKHSQLTDQQIKVTRSLHYIHEMAIAYKENRRASEAAEKAEIPPLPEGDFKSRFDFQK